MSGDFAHSSCVAEQCLGFGLPHPLVSVVAVQRITSDVIRIISIIYVVLDRSLLDGHGDINWLLYIKV